MESNAGALLDFAAHGVPFGVGVHVAGWVGEPSHGVGVAEMDGDDAEMLGLGLGLVRVGAGLTGRLGALGGLRGADLRGRTGMAAFGVDSGGDIVLKRNVAGGLSITLMCGFAGAADGARSTKAQNPTAAATITMTASRSGCLRISSAVQCRFASVIAGNVFVARWSPVTLAETLPVRNPVALAHFLVRLPVHSIPFM
jgi:hypothetical protein